MLSLSPKFIQSVFLLSLALMIPWLVMAPLSGMAFDARTCWGVYLFLWSFFDLSGFHNHRVDCETSNVVGHFSPRRERSGTLDFEQCDRWRLPLAIVDSN
jgi:hypothetical protein